MCKRVKVIFTAILFFSIICSTAVKSYAATSVPRISGAGRYQTAIEISKAGWTTSQNVVLATGEDFPDALCAAPLAKQLNAPILLTENLTLRSDLETELTRLGAKNVFIIGGQGVISKAVEDKLRLKGLNNIRISGVNREETSVKVAEYISSNFSIGKEAVVATGEDFPDALSIAPVAAVKGMPILLASKDVIPDVVKSYIKNKGVSAVYIIGGEGVVSEAARAQITTYSERVYGTDRYKTNSAVLNKFSGVINFGTTYVATGMDFPDALAGSALAPKTYSPIILTAAVPEQPTIDFMNSKFSYMNQVDVLGGEGVVPSAAYQTLVPTIASIANIDGGAVNPGQNYTLPAIVAASLSNGATKQFPVLWNPSVVNTIIPGTYTFQGTVNGYENKVTLTLKVNQIQIVSIANLSATVNAGQYYTLPAIVSANLSDGTTKQFPVVWNTSVVNTTTPGTYTYQGTVDGYANKVILMLTVNQVNQVLKHPIMGNYDITADQMARFLLYYNPNPQINPAPLDSATPANPYVDVVAFCRMFLEEGAIEGVRGDIAFAQSIKETGYFRFGGQVLPQQYNYAGIGATNGSPVGYGAWFKDQREGIRAQIQHLKAYASRTPIIQPIVDPRYNILVQNNLIGIAPNWEDLDGRWAVPGDGYGEGIVSIYERIKAY